MKAHVYRLIIPFLTVFLFSTVPYFIADDRLPDSRFQSFLDRIQTEKNIQTCLQQAYKLIEYQKSGMGSGPNLAAGESLANYFFRLGEAVLSRKDTIFLESALSAYTKSIELYPRLRHGWPFFQMGNVLEKMNRFKEARECYRMVERYDYGLLALRAGYQAARITAQLKDQPVSAYDLYTYFRFASVNVLQEIQFMGDSVFPDGDKILYLQGLLEYAQNHESAAAQQMVEYLMKSPNDPSAHYYYDRLSHAPMQPLYPTDGNLTESCYAPRVYRNQSFLLNDDSHIRADIYIPDPTGCELMVEAQCENPDQTPFELHFILNEETRSAHSTKDFSCRFTAKFSPMQEINHLELYIRILKEESDAVSTPPHIILRDFRAARLSPEKLL